MLKLNGYEIILASGSPRRKAFLEKLNIPFKVKVYPSDESYPSSLKGVEITEYIVAKKVNPLKKKFVQNKLSLQQTLWCVAITNTWESQKMLNMLNKC